MHLDEWSALSPTVNWLLGADPNTIWVIVHPVVNTDLAMVVFKVHHVLIQSASELLKS